MGFTAKLFLGTAAWVALFATGCGSTESDAGGSGKEPALCDGSADIRFMVTTGGGYVPSTFQFTDPYGASYLMLTGGCEYFVSQGMKGGLKTGTLDASRAQELAVAVHRSKIGSYSSWKDQSCPDAPTEVLSDGTNGAACSCECDPDAPKGLAPAFDAAWQWADTLFGEGTQSNGPVAAAAQPAQASGASVPWPFAWPITDLPTPNQPNGKIVTDAADVAKLRELRAAAISEYALVDVSGSPYELYVRDELPDDVKAALAKTK